MWDADATTTVVVVARDAACPGALPADSARHSAAVAAIATGIRRQEGRVRRSPGAGAQPMPGT